MKVKIVQFEDWTALYLDDRLAVEGHRLNVRDVLDALNVKHETFSGDDEWATYDTAGMPPRFSQVKLDESDG